jgi:hypothetical protein
VKPLGAALARTVRGAPCGVWWLVRLVWTVPEAAVTVLVWAGVAALAPAAVGARSRTVGRGSWWCDLTGPQASGCTAVQVPVTAADRAGVVAALAASAVLSAALVWMVGCSVRRAIAARESRRIIAGLARPAGSDR